MKNKIEKGIILIVVLVTAMSSISAIMSYNSLANFESPSYLNDTLVSDALEVEVVDERENIFYYVDSLCWLYGVDREVIIAIGENESDWLYPDSIKYVRRCGIKGEDSRGDLQVNMKYYKGDTDRISLLKQGIKYFKYQLNRYGSVEKARFAYARGHWRPKSEWKPIEKRFMGEFNGIDRLKLR